MEIESLHNPINYYLLIFREDKIVMSVSHTTACDAVIHLLNWGNNRDSKYGIDRVDIEIGYILTRHYSSGIMYGDATFGVIFTSDWLQKQPILPPFVVRGRKELTSAVYQFIVSLERDKKLKKLLE